MAANTNAELTKYIAYSSSLDLPVEKLEGFLMDILDVAEADGFAALRAEQKAAMDIFWQAADIQIDGDEALQQGLRFNLFHIMQSAGRDGKTGMGAKGLSGEGYEGHYFWDTEMYVLPVFIWTNPELAKQLLLYRYHTLPQARERAKVLGHPNGALYRIHQVLLEQYGMNTDIVFSRPNYCKIDMMPDNNRGDNLFLQEGEAAKLQRILTSHGIESIETLIKMAESFGTVEMPLRATTDAKYLEVGPTGKSDNANALFERFGFDAEDCGFWGDEFIGVTDSIFGSDAGMLTEKTRNGDFFDVSNLEGVRPQRVKQLGGGIQTFLAFLNEQA